MFISKPPIKSALYFEPWMCTLFLYDFKVLKMSKISFKYQNGMKMIKSYQSTECDDNIQGISLKAPMRAYNKMDITTYYQPKES